MKSYLLAILFCVYPSGLMNMFSLDSNQFEAVSSSSISMWPGLRAIIQAIKKKMGIKPDRVYRPANNGNGNF